MKLKNSHILLIVMAIFLLVSIGSVCASDMADDAVGSTDNVILGNDSSTGNTAEKIDTSIVSQDVKYRDTETKKIKDNESNSINIAKNNITVTENKTNLNFTYSNNSITLTDKLATGNHSLIIKYLGNDNYNSSTTSILLSIFGNYTIDVPASINVNSTKLVKVTAKVTNGVDSKTAGVNDFIVTLSYKEGNDTKIVKISKFVYNGEILLFAYNLNETITSSNMTIIYKNGTEEELSKTIKLNRIYNAKIEALNTKNEYKDGEFTFKLMDVDLNTPLAGKTVTLYVGTNIRMGTSVTTDSDGIASFKNSNMFYYEMVNNTITMKDFGVGNHAAEISTSSPIVSTSLKTNLTVEKANFNIQIDPLNEYYGTSKKLTITVTNANSKNPVVGLGVYFKITNSQGKEIGFTTIVNNETVKTNTVTTDSNGTAELPVNNMGGGSYSAYASLKNSANYNDAETTKTITIKQIPVTYSIGSTGIITVTNKLTGKAVEGAYVIVTFDDSKNKVIISYTDKDGKVKITTVGKHKIKVSDSYNGEDVDLRYTGSTVTKTITNKKITAKCSAPKVTTYYKADKSFTVTLTNSAKIPIYDAKLNVKIYVTSKRYYEYTGNTGLDGKILLSLNSLNPGTYKVVVTSGDTKSFTIKKVTSQIVVKKAPTTLTPKKLTAKKGTNTYFKVTVKNTKTKKVITGVKVKIKVYTGKKYKTYTVKTNSKGIAQINVKSLAVGTHKVVVSSANKYCVAKTATSSIKITKK